MLKGESENYILMFMELCFAGSVYSLLFNAYVGYGNKKVVQLLLCMYLQLSGSHPWVVLFTPPSLSLPPPPLSVSLSFSLTHTRIHLQTV